MFMRLPVGEWVCLEDSFNNFICDLFLRFAVCFESKQKETVITTLGFAHSHFSASQIMGVERGGKQAGRRKDVRENRDV